jgi:hypothetical protein
MHKLDGNRTLAHSGANALDRTVTHVAGYLLAGLAQVIVRTDVAGPCAHHSNQVTAVFFSLSWRRSIFVQYLSSSCSWLSKNVTMPSTICSPYWWLVGSGVWRIAEDPARGTLAASVPAKFRIFQKFPNFFLQHSD